MGLTARLLEFTRVITGNDAKASDVKVDPFGGANVTAKHFAGAGDDSYPLTSDYVALVPDANNGGEMAVGYLDPINEPLAQKGDKRIYARDPSDGSVVVEVWLQNDGTATVINSDGELTLSPDGSILGSNSNGSFELQAGGDFVVNGVTIDTSGNITSPATVKGNTVTQTSNNVTLGTHDHGGAPPTPGS